MEYNILKPNSVHVTGSKCSRNCISYEYISLFGKNINCTSKDFMINGSLEGLHRVNIDKSKKVFFVLLQAKMKL